ncbi:response regulator [Mycobacterium sp. ITM-2016-00318]|uniref:response regulator n=1 Tax=Mycobacterium sp. ITM-2016-00318 TaxID=2099693 RepID=UPI001304F50B|nr:response regulator [Mycobacterium sp. ITM-2016-00318]WNG93795.1 response regulator [Mycobacterium sp. ITM-2016-00318]
MNDPQIRSAVRKLATSIASALPQISTTSPQEESSPIDRAFDDLVDDYKAGSSPARNNSLVLWVDDRPDNNRIERKSMAPYGIEFVITTTTDEALSQLRGRKFDAVISDMGRPGDANAGLTLLEAMRRRGDQTACFFYTTPKSPEITADLLERGAQGVTYRGDKLLEMLLQQLGR